MKLTKEAIEQFGWTYIGKSIDLWFKKEGEFERHSWTSRKATMHYGEDNWLFIILDDTGEEHTIFEGKCETFEEFKQIVKFLQI